MFLTAVPSLLVSSVVLPCDVYLFSYWLPITPSPMHVFFFHVWYFRVLPNKELGLMCILDTLCWMVPKPVFVRARRVSRCDLRARGAQTPDTRSPGWLNYIPRRLICVEPQVRKVPFDAVSSGINLTTFRHRCYHLHGIKSFCPEDWESTSLRNVYRFISVYTASDPRRWDYSCFIFCCLLQLGLGYWVSVSIAIRNVKTCSLIVSIFPRIEGT